MQDHLRGDLSQGGLASLLGLVVRAVRGSLPSRSSGLPQARVYQRW